MITFATVVESDVGSDSKAVQFIHALNLSDWIVIIVYSILSFNHNCQGPTNIEPRRPGQAENFTWQVFCFSKKPAGPWWFTDK